MDSLDEQEFPWAISEFKLKSNRGMDIHSIRSTDNEFKEFENICCAEFYRIDHNN